MIASVIQENMSRLRKSCKRFVIKATALPLREPENSFTVHVNIRKDTGRNSDETPLESGALGLALFVTMLRMSG